MAVFVILTELRCGEPVNQPGGFPVPDVSAKGSAVTGAA